MRLQGAADLLAEREHGVVGDSVVDVGAVLVDSGMLARRKDGTHVYYRIADEGVFALCDQVCGSLQAQLSTLAALVGATSS